MKIGMLLCMMESKRTMESGVLGSWLAFTSSSYSSVVTVSSFKVFKVFQKGYIGILSLPAAFQHKLAANL